MTKLFRVSLLFLVTLAIFGLVGCQLMNPSDSDDNDYVPVVKNLVIPVVLPTADVATEGLTKIAIREADLSEDLKVQVLINGVSKSMGVPKYWSEYPGDTSKTVIFFADTIANLGMTDTSAIGTFTMTFQGGEVINIPAGRFEDILVTTAKWISPKDVVAGVARAMGVGIPPTTQDEVPTIAATIPRITLTRNTATGQMTMTTEKITIANGTAVPDENLGTPGTSLPAPIVVVTYVEAKAGKEYEAKLALLEVVRASRAEAGCISYDLYRGNNGTIPGGGVSTASTGKFVEVQKFRSMADLNAHVASAHVTSLFAKASELFINAPNQTSPFIAAIMQGDAGPVKTETGMLQYFGILQTVTTSEALVKTAMLDLVKQTRANEAGIMRYDMFQGAFNSSTTNLIILQNYQNAAALQAHLGATYFTQFMTNIAVAANVAFNEGFFIDLVTEEAPITVLTHMTANEGQADAAIAAMLDFVTKTRAEAGCISYDLYQGSQPWTGVGTATNQFVLREVWRDSEAISIHLGTAWFGTFMGNAATFFAPSAERLFDVTAMFTTLADKASVDGMLPGFGQMTAKEGQEAAAKTAWTNFMTGTRTETGNIKFDVFQGMPANGTPANVFQLFEIYANGEAIGIHGASDAANAFRTAMATIAQNFWGCALTMKSTPVVVADIRASIIAQPSSGTTPDISFYADAMNRRR
ncbi:MAG: antibiotic biosynthesis monooxygenase [Candidatus Riflebacteria bacterium]|nr:antibiotic biosynthesis monooxygenase [Candidatus Riflebacteria bacterium]